MADHKGLTFIGAACEMSCTPRCRYWMSSRTAVLESDANSRCRLAALKPIVGAAVNAKLPCHVRRRAAVQPGR